MLCDYSCKTENIIFFQLVILLIQLSPVNTNRKRNVSADIYTRCKRPARTVLTEMCYSIGSATRQGSSSLTRFIGQSVMTSRT